MIYVVDSSDTERIGTSAEEFHAILEEEELKDAKILVFANKQVANNAFGSVCRAQLLAVAAQPTYFPVVLSHFLPAAGFAGSS